MLSGINSGGKQMTTDRYRLSVSGVVTFGPEDLELRDLLLSDKEDRLRVPEALQELEEEATDVKITLEKIT